MAEIIKIKKGLDIPLKGSLTDEIITDTSATGFGIIPDDYPGMRWRVLVAPGDDVKVGSPVMEDKEGMGIKVVAPVCGKVVEVKRGDRRKVLAVTFQKEGEERAEIAADFSTEESTRETLRASGLWAMFRQRPYDIVPAAGAVFRDIFVTAFDSAPLAPEIVTRYLYEDLEEGLRILSTLTSGKVWLGTPYGSGITSSAAEVREFRGPHPAGNVGVQIAAIRPVNKGETVLTIDARTAARIGHLSLHHQLDLSCDVAVTGPKVITPLTVRTTIGVAVESLLAGNINNNETVRVISGNVLTGEQVDPKTGYLRFPWRQVTVIAEGDHADEFMGWASMNPKKFSVKRTFPAFLRGLTKPYDFDARVKGGHRAMILSGEYDRVFPFDIYPEYLLKAIMAKDIDKMEQLGIYEVAPEDFALPEFIDTSKNPLQKMVREGLDYLRSETE